MQYDAGEMKISRRNYYLMMIEGALFWFGASFIDGNAVISVFIMEATGSIQLAGLTATLRSCLVIVGQFLMGLAISRVAQIDRTMHIFGILSRSMILFIAPILLLGVSGYAAAICVVVMICLFYFFDGFVGLNWTEIGARTVPPQERASIQGYQQVIGGIAGLFSAMLVKLLLDSKTLGFTMKYASVFGLCGVVYIINVVVLFFIRDFDRNKQPKQKLPKIELFAYLKGFYTLWREDGNYRKIMYGRVLYVVSMMAASLIVIFGKGHCGLSDTQGSTMIYLQIGGQVAGGFLWVQVARRLGNNALMICSHALPVLIAGLGITAHVLGPSGMVSVVLVGAMVLISGMNVGAWFGYANRIIDTVKPQSRTNYLVMQALLQFPFTFASYFAGLLAETWSFLPVFFAILASSAVGLALCVQLYKSRDQVKIRVETGAGM